MVKEEYMYSNEYKGDINCVDCEHPRNEKPICVRDYTVVYSQPCVNAFIEMMKEFFKVFGITERLDEMFYYGVFCKPQNYVNYYDVNKIEGVPDVLLNSCNYEERLDFVRKTIKEVTMGEIAKPQWMCEVELNAECNEFGQAPSTFFSLVPVEEKYKYLGRRIVQFLYSPNMLITMVE